MLATINFTPPSDWHIGPAIVNVHSLAFCLGAISAYIWTYKRLPESYRDHLDPLASWMAIFGILGARFMFVALNFSSLKSPIHAFYFWEGGLVSYGGFIGAIVAWILYIKRNKLPMAIFCNALAPAALLGWGIGRLGCFLSWNNEYGVPTDLPWGFIVNGDVPRHPVMFYLAMGHIAMAFATLWIAKKIHHNPLGVALMAFGGVRLLFDIWRDYDPIWLYWGSATISFIFVVLGYIADKRIEPVD